MVDLPFNLDAEQALLGLLIIDNSLLLKVNEDFLSSHFYDPVHAKIYDAIKAICEKSNEADIITLHSRFVRDGSLGDIGGIEYLSILVNAAPDKDAIQDYSKLISDLFLRRQIIDVSAEFSDKAKKCEDDLFGGSQLVSEFESRVTQLSVAGVPSSQIKAGDLALQFAKDLRGGVRHGVCTGIISLDDTIGMLEAGELFMVGARPAMGKSAFMLQVAVNIAQSGKGVFINSMDMTRNQVTSRLISMLASSRIEYRDLVPEKMTDELQAIINQSAFEISQLPIVIDDRRGLNVDDILSSSRRARSNFERQGIELALCCVDHVQKIRPARANGNLYSESSDIARKLKDGAMVLKCPIMALSQLSRNIESRDDKHPNMSDFRDTGAWEEEADKMAALYRPAYYLRQDLEREQDATKWQQIKDRLSMTRNILEIDCLKVRQGEPKLVEVGIDIGINQIYEKRPHLVRTY